ncbi:hypothetical protein B0H14DRAFT_72060 [Mycena olivaceomarginata]|nr:hypothetical protein B0H14DRAFT_72060 [Mycena olivaceomarginata]
MRTPCFHRYPPSALGISDKRGWGAATILGATTAKPTLPRYFRSHPRLSSSDLRRALRVRGRVLRECRRRTHITYTCLLHLGGLPNLHGLHIQHFLDLHVKFRAVASSGRMFAALCELVFFSEAINSITSPSDAIDSNALDKIELTFDTLDLTTQDWFVQPLADESSSAIKTRSSLIPSLAQKSKTLTKLYLRERISFHDTPDALDRMLPVDWFHPLLSCANLTEVVILTANGIDIDDAFLKRMATAWPQLRTLDLSPGCQSAGYAPRTMLAGLLPLAQRCPRLESLALVLDASHRPRNT